MCIHNISIETLFVVTSLFKVLLGYFVKAWIFLQRTSFCITYISLSYFSFLKPKNKSKYNLYLISNIYTCTVWRIWTSCLWTGLCFFCSNLQYILGYVNFFNLSLFNKSPLLWCLEDLGLKYSFPKGPLILVYVWSKSGTVFMFLNKLWEY